METEDRPEKLMKDLSPLTLGSFGDEPDYFLTLPKLYNEDIFSKDKLIIPNEIKITEYIKDYPEKRFSSIEDDLSINIIELNKNYENLEKKDIYAPLMGKLALNSIIKNPNNLISKPSLGNTPAWLGQSSLQSSLRYVELGSIKPEDLPNLALPILEFIEDTQPHIIIGCDRGGRLFSLAIHAAWQQTRDCQRFPTIDSKIHFARVSKSEDENVLQEKVDHIVASAKQMATQRGIELPDDEQLRVMFVDDWVIGGGTMRLAQRLMKKHGAKTYFAVMCGNGADATGQSNLHTNVAWHDRPEEIGINYLSSLYENPDGTVVQRQEVLAVHGKEAIRNRKRIQAAAKVLQKVVQLEQVVKLP